MALRPLQDRIIVKRLEEENMTAGGDSDPGHRKGKAATRGNHSSRQRQGY